MLDKTMEDAKQMAIDFCEGVSRRTYDSKRFD